jgi:hypothetical protein
MAVLQTHHRSHSHNNFNPLGCLRPSFVYPSDITDRTLKREILGFDSIDWSSSYLLRDSQRLTGAFTDQGVLASWSRLQGLCYVCTSDAPSFNVHRNRSDLRDPSNCDACRTCTPTTGPFIRALEDALSTSIIFAHGKCSGLTSIPDRAGMGMACIGSRSRGAYSGK